VNYRELEATFRRIGHLDHAVAMLEWDEAVMMPASAGEMRADAVATLHGIRHELLCSEAVAQGLQAARVESDLTSAQRANVAEMHRAHVRALAVPRDLVEATKKANATSEQAWRRLRAENDWKAFAPLLKTVVSLQRETANCLAAALGMSPYDALMDGFEPGLTTAKVDELFQDLRAFLPAFTDEVVARQGGARIAEPKGPFSVAAQRALGVRLMTAIGFDLERGRLDVSHHPFCGGVASDVRITTRYSESDFTQSLMGMLHEAGHGKYEQGLPPELEGQPAGLARGMAMHESQSLLQEMQISRSPAFLRFAAPIMAEELGGGTQPEAFTAENLAALYTRVQRSFIRVDADEVTYPAHVILRYEIERSLIAGELEVDAIPEAWNAQMEELLGLSTQGNNKDGCMQDVHWPAGLFGYFPSYTVGALIAAQLFAGARSALGDLEGDIEAGRFDALNAWLGTNVWRKASSLSTEQIVEAATGKPLSTEAFKAHLQTRYLG